jgi:hypothetical protein
VLSGRQVICYLWRAEMWHTAGLTALDPSGQWQVNSQQGLAGKLSLRTNMFSIFKKELTKKIFFFRNFKLKLKCFAIVKFIFFIFPT